MESGVLVSDKFTTEPNKPHLLVIFYFAIGKLAEFLKVTPEVIYAYIGAVFTFLFVLVLFAFVEKFFERKSQIWWVFLVTLFGGGLGAYFRILSDKSFVRNNFLLNKIIAESYWSWPTVFEAYRGNYIITSIFDTHFIFIWLLTTVSVFALFMTFRKFSWFRLIVTVFFFALTTLVHIYEGITLVAILVMITGLLWKRKLADKHVYLTSAILTGVVGLGILFFFLLYRSSGLEVPSWRGLNILFSILIISYPLAWLIIFPGIVKFWQNAGFEDTFLIGWALGCLILTLSGPYFPYPDRGTMTLQIPLYIIAGLIFFRHYQKVTWLAAVAAIVLVGMTPAWKIQAAWENSTFQPDLPSIWLSNDQVDIIQRLNSSATTDDVLITDMSKPDWEVDALWLAPDYPGKLYCAHFFLTVDFDNKRNELIKFYNPQTTIDERIAFMNNKQIRFVYVNGDQNPGPLGQIPGLSLLISNTAGSLFEYSPAQ